MKKNYFFPQLQLIYYQINSRLNYKWIISVFVLCCFSLSGYAQKEKEIIPLVCVKKIDAGLFQATFSYENPTKKEVVIDENGSIIKSNNGKKVAKGLNRFKPGLNKKAFTKEFGPGDFVEWTITSNGQTKTVVANGNSAYCEPDDSFIFPVIGNGKSFDLIGQELTSLCDGIAGDEPSPLIFQLNDNKVLVEIIPVKGQFQGAIDLLKGITPQCSTIASPFNIPDSDFLLYDSTKTIEEVLEGLAAIDVFIAEDVICKLNDYPCVINFARPAYPSIKNAFADGNTGLAVSQGDATQTTDIVRESFKLIDADGNVLPVDGKGITIGVMSNSFDRQPFSTGNPSKATLDVIAGDLPGEGNENYVTPVDVLLDYPFGEASDEGRAMMHIIHDIAPGAKLAFHASSLSPRNFEVGFKALAGLNESNELIELDLKSNIIVDDISFVTEPFFGEGRISAAIDAFTDAGGIHFTSAGNFGDNGFQGVFNPSSGVPVTNFIDSNLTRAHVFGINSDGSEDYLQKISVVEGTYMIALQWKEAAASQANEQGALDDLDIYIVDDLGRLLVGSNRVNIAGDPTEVIVFRATGSGDANILITSANGDTSVPFRYIAFQSEGLTWEFETPGTPTVSGHAMTENSVTVGAIRYNKTEPEVFSSFGGTLADGNQVVAIDFAAPDGVDTNVGSIGTKYFSNGVPVDETPEYPNFFGTSASAPSAAAAVALLQSALPTWYPDLSNPGESSISVSDVIDLFKENVRDGSSINPQAGAGMIDANKVFNSLAAQTGRITSFVFDPVTDSENASIKTVTIKIIGEFFPDLDSGDTYDPNLDPGEDNKPVVYLDGVAIAYTVGEDGEILATIPPFSGNPDLQIYTAPKDGTEGNGGFSEPYKFFQDGKNIITVTANPMTIKFGEEYKSKLTYTVEGIELPEGETSYATVLSNLGFPDIVLETPVDNVDYPDVNNYPISPSFDGSFVDTDADGVPDVYDQCPETPADAIEVDSNGCTVAQKEAEGFTPATTYKVNFIAKNLAIEKNNLIIRPKDIDNATYGEKIAVELEYSGFGITNDAGVESFELINDPEAFLNKIKGEHLKDFYKDAATGITPVGIINNFKPGETFDALGVDRYQDILDLLENGSWISSENTFLNRLEENPYRGGSYPVDAGFAERVYGSVNTDLGTGFINFNPLDFTAYLDEFAPDKSIENGQALGIINGQALGIINGQSIGIINGQALGIINGQAIGIINGQAIGIVNGQAFGIVNGQAFGIVNGQAFGIINGQAFGIINNDSGLGTGLDTNDYDKVFSLIDATDYSAQCLTEGNCSISTYYALNLITGVEATDSAPQYIFPGSFINPISDNFNIIYQKGELTVAKKDLTTETTSLSLPYGGDISAAISTEFDFAYDDTTESVFPDGIPYYFENTDGSDTKEYELGDKMNVGTYNIKIRDIADNYTILNGLGQLTITEATLTVDATIAENIKYGETPSITAEISGFPYNDDADTSNDEDASTLFPEDEGGIPYFFMKQGETPDCDTCVKYYIPYVAGADKMDVGVYDIFIMDEDADNYKIEFAADRGNLTVEPATLTATTTALSLEYGDDVSESIVSTISGFAYVDENESTVFPDGSGGALIPYIFTDEAGSVLEIASVKERGIYTIEVTAPVSGNYVMDYGLEHGDLTITEATLSFDPIAAPVTYGNDPVIDPQFEGFADGEGASNLINATYYFKKDGDPTEYTIGGPDKMDVGTYKIFINDDITDNYSIVREGSGTLTINKAALVVTISPEESIVSQGDIPMLTTLISDSAYNEKVVDVFGSPVPYEFEDENGAIFYDTSIPGVFKVRVPEPANYLISYANEATLLINSDGNSRKVRTYADCVKYNESTDDYTVIFRYENENDEVVFVPVGDDNNLDGGVIEGKPPTSFVPGTGTFEIRFDGNPLTWSLTTFGSTNKSSVSSLNQSGTGECDAKIDADYTLYPNPVTGNQLTITQNVAEVSTVFVLDMYGRVLYPEYGFDGTNNTIYIDMSDANRYPSGMYIVKIVSQDQVKTYSIIKE